MPYPLMNAQMARGTIRSAQAWAENLPILDNGKPPKMVNPATANLGIGRLVIGSSALVERLSREFGPDHVVQAHGQLVMPYTHSRLLADAWQPMEIARGGMKAIYTTKRYPDQIVTNGSKITDNGWGDERTVRVVVKGIPARMRDESDRLNTYLSDYFETPVRHPLRLDTVRLVSESDAKAAQEMVDDAIPKFTRLTAPVIIGTPKAAQA